MRVPGIVKIFKGGGNPISRRYGGDALLFLIHIQTPVDQYVHPFSPENLRSGTDDSQKRLMELPVIAKKDPVTSG